MGLDSKNNSYVIEAKVDVSYPDAHGIAYIGLSEPRQVDRTIIVCDGVDNTGIHIDLDAEGRLLGIELMSAKLLPPRNCNGTTQSKLK